MVFKYPFAPSPIYRSLRRVIFAFVVMTVLAQQRAIAQAGIPQLLQQLESSDSTVRGSAAIQLESIHDPNDVPALLEAFRNTPKQRNVLLRALAHFKDPRKIPLFISVIQQGNRGSPVWSDPIVLQLKELGAPAARALMGSFAEMCTEEEMEWIGTALAEFDDAGVYLALEGLGMEGDECRQGAGAHALFTYFRPGFEESSAESEGIFLLAGAAQSKNLAVRLVAQEWIKKNLNAPLDKMDFRTMYEPLLRTYRRAQKVSTKLAVLEAMADFTDDRVAQLMRLAVKDSDPQLHAFASKWLVDHPGPVVEENPATMPDKTPEEKLAKLKRWGENENADDTAETAKYLSDQDPRVRVAAATAISTINAAPTDPRGHDERPRDTEGANAALAARLHDSDAQVRAAVVTALGEVNNVEFGGGDANEITPQLTPLVKDPDVSVQAALAEALGKIADPASASALIELSSSRDVQVRYNAVRALIRFSTPEVTCRKFALLRDPDVGVRGNAATGLFNNIPSGVRCPGDVEALIAALQDPAERDWVRLPLGGFKDKRAVGPLLADLKTQGEPRSMYCHDCQALAMIGDPSAIEPMAEFLYSPNPVIANGAAQAIAGFKDPKAFAVLTRLLKDDRAEMRITAIQGLAGFGQCQLAAEFRRYLTDDAEGVRAAAAEAAAKCKDTEAVEPLIRLLAAQPIPAAAALGKLGDVRAVPPLLETLKQKSVWGRGAIVHALGELHDTRAVDLLIALLHDNSAEKYTVIGEAAWALAEIGDRRAIPALQQVVVQAGPGTVPYADEATKALQKFGSPVPPRQGK